MNQRYQYPRYNLIYKLYSYLSDLGAHKNEGNKLQSGGVDSEDCSMEDAFLGLRMTEDMLVWVYQSNAMNQN